MTENYSSFQIDKIIGIKKYNKLACFKLFCWGVLCSLVFHINITVGIFFYFVSIFAILVGLSVCFLPIRHIHIPILIIILLMPDITQTIEDAQLRGTITSASLWQITIPSISPSIFILCSLIVASFRTLLLAKFKYHLVFLIFFFGVSLVTSIIYGFIFESPARFVADFKMPLFLYLSFIFFYSYLRLFPDNLSRVIQIVFVWLLSWWVSETSINLISPPNIEPGLSYANLSLDSGKGLILTFAFYAIAKIVKGKNVILWAAFTLLVVYVTIMLQTRWLIVTFISGLGLIFLLIGGKRKIIFSLILVPSLIIGISILYYMKIDAFEIMLVRFSFIQNIFSGEESGSIESVRIGSIVNSFKTLWNHSAILTGMGYGSWYTDNYFPMDDLTVGAFDEISLETEKYYRIHDFFFHFLFKFGLLGIVIYVSLFVAPLKNLWSYRKYFMGVNGGTELIFICFGLAPTIVTYMWFTGKGNMFCGLYIVLCTFYVANGKNLKRFLLDYQYLR